MGTRRSACALLAAGVIGDVTDHDCDVFGNCPLLRGPGRDVTDPSGRRGGGWSPPGAAGGVDHR